jgi:hypothetical protein
LSVFIFLFFLSQMVGQGGAGSVAESFEAGKDIFIWEALLTQEQNGSILGVNWNDFELEDCRVKI